MSFDIDRLLKSKSLCLTTGQLQAASHSNDDETALWQDRSSPLRLSQIGRSGPTHYRLHLDNDVAVDILPKRQLQILANPDIPAITIAHFLADQVLPRVVAQDGEFVLHSGAVRFGGSAILFLGTSGRGKSTLATSFHSNGWPLMGDDAIIISTGETPSATALYPSLRLFPDSIAALLPKDISSEEIAHYSDKQRLPVAIVKDIEPASAPIKAIFVIDEPSATEISVTRLSIADACMALVENSFALDPTDPLRARNRLDAASNLSREVPAFAISYPRDYARLPDVRSAIMTQLN